jgi:hypothetical protein
LGAMAVPKVVGDAGERVIMLLAGLREGKEEGTSEDGFAAKVGARWVRPNRAPVYQAAALRQSRRRGGARRRGRSRGSRRFTRRRR